MFVTQKPPALTLIAQDGQKWGFDSLEQFVEHYGLAWIRASLGTQFRDWRFVAPGLSDEKVCYEHPFVLRDREGEPVTVEDCENFWQERWKLMSLARKAARQYSFKGRGVTVPSIRCCRGGRHHFFRHIHTFPQLRAAAAVLSCEGEPPFRCARDGLMPSNWDDIPSGNWRVKNWKRYRRTQYAPRNERNLRRRAKKMPQE